MATQSLNDLRGYISHKVEQDHLTHREISERLQARFPGVRGFSIRSVSRFCQDKGIHKISRLCQAEVEQVVAEDVAKVFDKYVTNAASRVSAIHLSVKTPPSNVHGLTPAVCLLRRAFAL